MSGGGANIVAGASVTASRFDGSGQGLINIPASGVSGLATNQSDVAAATTTLSSSKLAKAGDTMTGALTMSGPTANIVAGASVTASGLFGNSIAVATASVSASLVAASMSVSGNSFSVGGSTLVASGGRVGIGTGSPGTLLHISGEYITNYGELRIDGLTTHAYMIFNAPANQEAGFQMLSAGTPKWYFYRTTADSFAMYNSAGGSGTQLLLKSDGTTGIGINAAPTTALTVYGVITSSNPAPSITCSAGTGVVGAQSTSQAGSFVAGALATSCTITFSSAWPKRPSCFCNDETNTLLTRAVANTTTLVCSSLSALTGDTVTYGCQGAP